MGKRLVAALLLFAFASQAGAVSLTLKIRMCARDGDELAVRILTLRASRVKLNDEHWSEIRDVLHHHPGVGWDLVRAWDKIHPIGDTSGRPIDAEMSKGDDLASTGKFKEATVVYLEVAKRLRHTDIGFGKPNFFAYQTLLHALARSLYGEGRFNESAQVYGWISTLYPFIRQIQFEKMWAAFRAKNYSLTLGAITSQHSSYFSEFLDPEAYLVQYYLYRRMCRKDDLAKLSNAIHRYEKLLDDKKFGVDLWARRDIETMSLLRLTHPQDKDCGFVDESDRKAEMKTIYETLIKRYEIDLPRIESQIKRVGAYLDLAGEATKEDLPDIKKIPSIKKILSSDMEMWEVDDAEDWLDEVGKHRFVGKSECG